MQVSVIIPVYNAAQYVEEAVQSALMQSETGEIILVDDGSTDGSYEICQRLAQNPKIQLVTHPNRENRRAGATRNLGIQHASCEFIAFLDADDYYLKNRFRKAKEVFQKYPDADGTFDLLAIQYDSDKAKTIFNSHQKNTVYAFKLQSNTPPSKLFEQFVLGATAFSLHTLVIRKASLTPELFFDEKLFQGQDTDFNLKWIYKKKILPASTQKAVSVYRIHENNTVHNKTEACKYKFKTYRPWVQKIRYNQWPPVVNRALLRHLLSGVSCHPILIVRLSKKIFFLATFFIKQPWILAKLI